MGRIRKYLIAILNTSKYDEKEKNWVYSGEQGKRYLGIETSDLTWFLSDRGNLYEHNNGLLDITEEL